MLPRIGCQGLNSIAESLFFCLNTAMREAGVYKRMYPMTVHQRPVALFATGIFGPSALYRLFVITFLAVPFAMADDVWPPPPPWQTAKEEVQEEEEEERHSDIPERWLERGRGLREALEIQEATGADMLVYISSRNPPWAADRSRRFERSILRSSEFNDALQDYIRVQLYVPGDRDSNEFAERYNVRFGPRILIVRPTGFAMSISPYTRDERDELVMREEEEIIRHIRERSSTRHQTQEPAGE